MSLSLNFNATYLGKHDPFSDFVFDWKYGDLDFKI